MNDINLMKKAANNIRILSASMVEKANSGHPGGAMGAADFINVLFSEFIEYDPDNAKWESRDRFFLDPGHMSPMLYSVLCLSGKFSLDDLKGFRQWGSITPGHPEIDVMRGIENTSGPLGQGHTYGVGAAIAAKFLKHRLGESMNQTIYSFISDGGIQEEISSNSVQLSTFTDAVTSEDVAKKYEAWNWNVIKINGNDTKDIRKALKKAKEEKRKPTLIIGETIMGMGALTAECELFEGQVSMHGQPLSAAGGCITKTIEGLGGNNDTPFAIFPEVAELYKKREDELRKIVADKKEIIAKWDNENPELADKKKKWFNRELPVINWEAIEQKANQATRAASANVLSALAENVENMIVGSADLSNSDKTDGFLKKTTAFKHGDFSGAFLQAGVSELTLAGLCVGMSLHGGVIPACGTFFVFSDYMKPVIRVAALMEQPVIFIWTHDAFRVGEDGPTHQPIEQEAQIRLLEKLQNHSGNNAMLVLRPADVNETTVAWKMAFENAKTPTGLILSRQNITNIPTEGNAYHEALQVEKGAYIVQDDTNYDVILLASGSEVSTLVEGAKLLNDDGIKTRIISVPSEGLFRSQSKEYQQTVLPHGKKVFGLTAGLPVTLLGLVGTEGSIWGMNSFGFSAPYTVLDEKMGFTGKNVYKQVKDFLNEN